MSVIERQIPIPLIRTLVETYYSFQDQRIVIGNRIKATQKLNDITDEELEKINILAILKNAQKFELDLKLQITNEVKQHEIYTKHLAEITGIGTVLAGGLMAYIEDVNRFKNISKLWQYSGVGLNTFCTKCKKPTSVEVEYSSAKGKKTKTRKLAPMKECPDCGTKTTGIPQKRIKGYQANWNDNMKKLLWKVATSFVKQKKENSGYRRIYDDIKLRFQREHPKEIKDGKRTLYTKGHINNMTLKIVEKIFLAHLWIRWRELEGLQVTEPYSTTLLGHDTIKPFTDKKMIDSK